MKIKLRTSGFLVNVPAELPSQRTYVVLGAPRGGTSMLAGAIRLSDIPMGVRLDQANNEDLDFNTHGGDIRIFNDGDARQKYLAHARATIAKRNDAHDVWGWKDPLANYYLDEVLPVLRNPFLLIVTRDLTAVALRERTELPPANEKNVDNKFMYRKMSAALSMYERAIDVAKLHSFPALVISYERTLRYAEDFARQVRSFCGKDASVGDKAEQDAIRKIVEFVRPDAISGNIEVDGHELRPFQAGLRSEPSAFLASIKSLTEGYSRAAERLNSSDFEGALTAIEALLPLRTSAYRSAPHLAVNPAVAMDIETGLLHMKAVAMINLNEPQEAYLALSAFSARANLASASGAAGEIVRSLLASARNLDQRLSDVLLGRKSSLSLPEERSA